MTKDEALDLALEALEYFSDTSPTMAGKAHAEDAITAIKQARSAPVQEPSYETLWHKVWPDAGSFVRASADDLRKFARSVATPPAQPAPVQEPVARVIDDGTPEGAIEWIPFVNRVEPLKTGDLLYTTPPAAQRQWVGLTDEERDDLLDNYITAEGRARAIEAKLKEKNT